MTHSESYSDSKRLRGGILVVFLCIIALAGMLRLLYLDAYPPPVNEDELSNIYDGWSIAETWADRSSRRFPILCKGWGPGDYRPSMFAWLCAGVSAWTGFSVIACRAVSGVLGTLTVGLAGLWGYRAFGHLGAMVFAALLTVSPWHLQFSRFAHEGTALPGIFVIAILLLLRRSAMVTQRGASARWWWFSAGLMIGLSTSSYGATRLTGLLFAVLAFGMAIYAGRVSRMGISNVATMLGALVLGTTLGASPQIWSFFSEREAFLGRANVVVFHAFDLIDAVEVFFGNVWANLDPRYLFMNFGEPGKLPVGRCLTVGLPFFYFGIMLLLVPWSRISWIDRILLLGGVLICIAPAAVTRTNPNGYRASGCAVMVPMVVATGMCFCLQWISGRISRESHATRNITVVMVIIILSSGAYNILRYVRSDSLQQINQQTELVSLGKWLRGRGDRYDRVYLAAGGNQSDLYIVAFGGMTPQEFQSAERVVWGNVNEYCTQLNQYYFIGHIKEAYQAWEASARNERWLVVNRDRTVVSELTPGMSAGGLLGE